MPNKFSFGTALRIFGIKEENMTLRTWIFPEHGGIIPGIPGHFPGGTKVVIDEDANSIISVGALYPPVLPENSAVITVEQDEIITPGYKKVKSNPSESSES